MFFIQMIYIRESFLSFYINFYFLNISFLKMYVSDLTEIFVCTN